MAGVSAHITATVSSANARSLVTLMSVLRFSDFDEQFLQQTTMLARRG